MGGTRQQSGHFIRQLLGRLRTSSVLLQNSRRSDVPAQAWCTSKASAQSGRPAEAPSAATRAWCWGFATAVSAGLAVHCVQPWQAARAGEEELDEGTLGQLARDLSSSRMADRERAISMLSGLTVFLEHHQAMLRAGLLPALMKAVLDTEMVPQVRSIALGCLADLAKNQEAHDAAVASKELLPAIIEAAQAHGTWSNGPEDGGVARSLAARLLAELAGDPKMHPALVDSGAAAVLARQGAALSEKSRADDKTYSSMSEVPGNLVDVKSVEEERYTASALFGLSGSKQGIQCMLQADAPVVPGLANWATCHDPILQRYGVGALARLVISGLEGLQAAQKDGSLNALFSALLSKDGQAQCYAAGAAGKLAHAGGKSAQAVLQANAPEGLLEMLDPARESENGGAAVLGNSPGVRQGVFVCALRAIAECAQEPQLRKALQNLNASELLQDLLDSGIFDNNATAQSLAEASIQHLATSPA
ncbi:hypothetical protein WJX72_004304 [[Myrmecia] bisecta]|uniref:Uncharacterized protein n=1 Tax=[Myrmecia] bisecta TaxID=41462 RepID=A0AAW1R5V0_9CHLO